MKKQLILIGKGMVLGGVLFGLSQSVLAEETLNSTEVTVMTSEQVEVLTEVTEETKKVEAEPTKESQVPTPDLTMEEVKTVEEGIDELIKEQITETTGELVSLEGEYSADDIRQNLLSNDFGMTKETLASYTDQQLVDGMTLFFRYNTDIVGMDLGAYVRLLTVLYVDQTVAIDQALGQLSFNPAGFTTFSEMIPQIEQLQTYLKVLYPVSSSFFSAENVTNDHLIAILNYLSSYEEKVKAEGGKLEGRMVYILNAITTGIPSEVTEPATSEAKSDDNQTQKSTQTDEKENGGKLKLPQTGEEKAKFALTIIGIVLIVGVVFVVIKKSKNK